MRPLLLVLMIPAAFCADLPDQAAKLLRDRCTNCHGAAKTSNLDLRSRQTMLTGGERGPAVEPGDASKSRLYRMAAGLDQPSMPPGKKLSATEVELLKQWIEAGAELPEEAFKEDARVVQTKLEERPITAAERSYWAFQKPIRRTPPAGASNPVDAFLNAALAAKHVQPALAADRRALIRRAYLDLTGLPPSIEQVDAFLADKSHDAFAKVVEQLLASPAYGERWGRHWLDLVRYSDSGGFEYDRDRGNAWRYRDYVIAAFNSDKPYDRFLEEQLAGDEIQPASNEARIATGFLRLGLENNIKTEQTRMDELDDLVGVSSNAFLGLTVQCARCHNHKFDPIAQKDYYRMQAVFFPTKATEFPLAPQDEVERHKAAEKRITDLQAPLKKQLSEIDKPYRNRIIEEKKSKLPDYIQLALNTPPEKRTEGQRLNAHQFEKGITIEPKEVFATYSAADTARRKEIEAEIARLEGERPKPLETAMSIVEPGREAPPSYFLYRGSPGSKGSLMKPGVLTVASSGEWTFPDPPADAKTSGRRKAFAEWLTSPDNPLTARTMVNRIWQQHFGEGLVRTPSNFGKTGEAPTHPELLDWLATEFVAKGWSVKAMHRLLMNSEAYQRASDDVAASAKIDPDNRLLWRMPRRRLEAEAVRDGIFAVAGNLDRTVGGPGVFPYIDPALFQSSSKRTWNGKPDTDPSTWRRSVYVFSKRSIPLPMFDVFDRPDSVGSCARRNRSTIAPQALILMNNSMVTMEAGFFADRLRKEAGAEPNAQVQRAFEVALSRPPTQAEAERSVAFIKAGPNGLTDFCQGIFSLNEFVFLP